MTNEDLARQVGESKKLLKQRLKEAKSCLNKSFRAEFGDGIFDFENKCLIGANGLVLQWRLRSNPDQPESYTNQQTSRGTVVIVRSCRQCKH